MMCSEPRSDLEGRSVARPWAAELGQVSRLAVFRALNLGDMLCFVPALRAIRAAWPEAHICLIGLESARPVVERFPELVDELILFPGDPAFPEKPVAHDALPGFYRDIRSRRFDLILQMHGSGPQSNDIVGRMQPKQWAGFIPAGAAAEPHLLPWPDTLHEVHRYLALLQHLGLAAEDDGLSLPVSAEEEQAAKLLALRYGLQLERTVCIHGGARLASRRWPLERYAQVARSLGMEGWHIALTGSEEEGPLASQLQRMAAGAGIKVEVLCGQTPLGVLAALIRTSRLLICNDTGISHVAAAVQAASVVIASGSDVRRWAPLNERLHTVLHSDPPCRPCAYDVCPVGHVCALGVHVDQVMYEAHNRLSASDDGPKAMAHTSYAGAGARV